MVCYLCGCPQSERVEGTVRDRPEIGIRRCMDCRLVFLESFDHIPRDYYDGSYTEEQLTGQTWQSYLDECRVDDERRFAQLREDISGRRYLDVGCGAGGVLLQARLVATAASGVEPQGTWRRELAATGIPIHARLSEVRDVSQDVISLFHVLEHVADPLPFLRQVASKAAPGGMLFIEVPSADDALLSFYKNAAFSRFTYWSPHLFLYNQDTLKRLLAKADIAADITVAQFQRYPLSNHLMWLAQGKPGGHQKWAFLDTPALNEAYSERLASLGGCDTLIATVRVP